MRESEMPWPGERSRQGLTDQRRSAELLKAGGGSIAAQRKGGELNRRIARLEALLGTRPAPEARPANPFAPQPRFDVEAFERYQWRAVSGPDAQLQLRAADFNAEKHGE